MELNRPLNCPVSTDKINENIARIAASFTIVVAAISLYFDNYIVTAFLGIDFAIRAFSPGNYSLVKFLSKQMGKGLRVKGKLVDAAPKKFAAGIGMFFCLLIAVFQLSHWTIGANVVGGILIFCALLEAGIAFCLGCIVYTYTILPFKR